MKFRIISQNGYGAALALKIAKEGHKVDLYIHSKAPIYHGILAQVEAWNIGLTPETLIIFDGDGFGGLSDGLKRDGAFVYGTGKLNDALEKNFDIAAQFAKNAKIKVPAYSSFKNFDEAIDFAERSGKAWVYRKDDYIYVPQSDETVDILKYFKTVWEEPCQFYLVEKIEGFEVTVEQHYLNGEPVCGTLNSSVSERRLFDKDRGPFSGYMGSVSWFWQKLEPKLYRLTLQRMERSLKDLKHCGPLGVNCIISKEDMLPYFVGFKSHLRFGAFYALCEGMENSISEFLASLALGKKPALQRSFDWLGCVRVAIPPYPYAAKPNVPVIVGDNVNIIGVKLNGDRTLLSAGGTNGVICEMTTRGKSLPILDREIYKAIDDMRIPEKQYRSDVIKLAKEKIGKLKKLKYFGDR